MDDNDGRHRPRDRPEQPAHPLRRLLAGAAHALEPRRAAAPGSGLYKIDRRRRHLDEARRRRACPKGLWGRIGVRVSPARPEPRLGHDRGRGGRRLPLRRRRRAPGSARTTSATCASAPGTTRHVYADPKDADTVYVLNVQFLPLEDGGKTFQTHPRAARRQPRPVDRPERPAADDRRQRRRRHGQLRRRRELVDARQPADRAVLPRRSPTTGSRTASTARSRTTPRSAIASRTDGRGIGIARLARGGRLRERLHRAEARRSRRRLRRLLRRLHRRGYDQRTGQERDDHGLARQPDGLGRRGHEVPLPVDLPDRGLAARPEDALYAAGNVLFRTRNEGQSWEAISPDLTRNDKTKLGPSGRPDHQGQHQRRVLRHDLRPRRVAARRQGVLWAGSDDGLVHVTRDGGQDVGRT